jgi:integrase/recombinase XerD
MKSCACSRAFRVAAATARVTKRYSFFCNTGARAQEVADLQVGHLELGPHPRVRLRGKGYKWRTCPLWVDTARHLRSLVDQSGAPPGSPVFCSRPGEGLTRFGIYKLVRKHGSGFDREGNHPRRVTPHLFRHTAAVHLLEAGVDMNVIRGWLGHASIETTYHYAQITVKMKMEALQAMEVPSSSSAAGRRRVGWKDDEKLLQWLDAL